MKNLDQIRAVNALQHKDRILASQGGGDAVSGFPMLILADGLLAALAFATEWKGVQGEPQTENDMKRQAGGSWQARKHPGEYTVARALANHLSSEGIAITGRTTADELLVELAGQESDRLLRRSSAEARWYLNFLKRFVA